MDTKSGEQMQSFRTLYQEVCRAHDSIQEFRGNLLGFLPLASGAGIFLLLDKNFLGNDSTITTPFLLPIGCFGFVVTLGLLCYEYQGMIDCLDLLNRARSLEPSLGLPQFPLGSVWPAVVAAWLIYSGVLFAWCFLAYIGVHVGLVFVPAIVISFVTLVVFVIKVRQWRATACHV